MCVNCGSAGIGRRDFMKFGAAGAIALGQWRRIACGAGGGRRADRALPEQALAALKSGNERFVSHPELCSVDLAESRAAVAAHQAPWATIISCADSRVPPELIFGGSRRRRTVRRPRRRQSRRRRHPRDDRIWRRRARLSAHRHPRPYRLRRGESRMRRGDQERNLSWRDRPDDRADRAGGARGAQRSGDFTNNSAKESAKRTAAKLPGLSAIVGDLVDAGKVKIVAAIYDLETGVVTYLD